MRKVEVSIITPTYNRRKFIPILIKCILQQTYPLEKIEWLIYDDGEDKIEDLVKDLDFVRYFSSDDKKYLGEKRNFLNENARGNYIVCMDDDDYYPPERVSHAVAKLKSTTYQLVGNSCLFIYHASHKKITSLGPFTIYHSCNGALAYKKEYTKTHRYIDKREKGEEPNFLNNFREPLLQLNPFKTMLCIDHGTNTVEKKLSRPSELTLLNFVQDKEIREFYENL